MSFNIYRRYREDKTAIVTVSDIKAGRHATSKELLQDLLTVYGPASGVDRGGLTVTRQAGELILEDGEKIVRFQLSTDTSGAFFIEFLELRSKGARE